MSANDSVKPLVVFLIVIGSFLMPVSGENTDSQGYYWLKYLKSGDKPLLDTGTIPGILQVLDEDTMNGIPLNPGGGDGYVFYGSDYNDGWIDITDPGIYCLTGDLHTKSSYYSIRILATHDVILNGKKHDLVYEGSDNQESVGIDIQANATGTTIFNIGQPESGGIQGYKTAVRSFAGITLLAGIRMEKNEHGIYSFGIGNTIAGNAARDNERGIQAEGAGICIAGNSVSNNNEGIYSNSTSSIFVGNQAEGNKKGITTSGSSLLIMENTVINNTEGVTAFGSSVDFEGNRIEKNGAGIVSTGSSVNIAGNTVSLNDEGIISTGSSANIGENQVSENGNGINSSGSVANIARNNITGNAIGINSTGDSPNLMDNDVKENGIGIRVRDVTASQVADSNNLQGNREDVVITSDEISAPLPPSSSGTSAAPVITPVPDTTLLGTKLVVSDIHLSEGAGCGTLSNLSINISSTGNKRILPGTRVIFVPANNQAQRMGIITATMDEDMLHLDPVVSIPSLPGSYEYLFNPRMVAVNVTTGDESYSPVGLILRFRIVVSEDGSVSVSL